MDLVFKRRHKLTWGQTLVGMIYPKGGWSRSVRYVRHRLNRLPDSPERIARGIFAGVATTFTPFFGLHFVVAFLIAKVMRGNVLAALMATFFGNPLTYVPIAIVSLKTGHWLLGRQVGRHIEHSVQDSFFWAMGDLWHNVTALFTARDADWSHLIEFFDQVFYPYLIGGLIPGVIAGLIAYYTSLPVIRAYQKRRSNRLRNKLNASRKKAQRMADAAHNSD